MASLNSKLNHQGQSISSYYLGKTGHPPFREVWEDTHPIFHPQDLQLSSEGGIALHLALQLCHRSSFDLHVLRRFDNPRWIYQQKTFGFSNDQEAESFLIKGRWLTFNEKFSGEARGAFGVVCQTFVLAHIFHLDFVNLQGAILQERISLSI